MLNPQWKDDNQLLIEEFRNGNKKAFHYIYNLHNATLFSYANKIIDAPEEAEDIVANAFMKVWERRHTFDSADELRPYLFTVTRNACFDFLKHSQRKDASHKQILKMSQEDEEAELQANMIRAELLNKVLAEVENMPVKMKEIFLMTFVDGMKTAEIAQQLNITEETVRGQKAKAVKLLKKILGEKGLSALLISPASLALLKLMLHL